jgi:CubicO group peptidase (beta-lactamase class C family)
MRRLCSILLSCLACLLPLTHGSAQSSRLDSLDAFVKAKMDQRHVRGLSLAIIKDGKIAVARAYGITDDSTKSPVSTRCSSRPG